MIVSNRPGGTLCLVRQNDHAHLAGQLAAHWGNELFERPEPYESVCMATSRHDEAWLELDEQPLYNEKTKRPLNFIEIDLLEHAYFYRKGVERVIADDPYAGILDSMHWTGIYCHRWGWDPAMTVTPSDKEQTFLNTIIKEQEAVQFLLKQSVMRPNERRSTFEQRLWMNYELLQVWDVLALFISMEDLGQAAEKRRIGTIPVRLGGPIEEIWIQPLGDGVVSIDPYPFHKNPFQVSVRGRVIPDKQYESQTELREAVLQAPEINIQCTWVPMQDDGEIRTAM